MKTIQDLENEIVAVSKGHKTDIDSLEMELKEKYYTIFEDMPLIPKLVSELEDSNDYMLDEEGMVCHWIHCVELFKPFESDEVTHYWEFLDEYLQDNYCCYLDKNNDSLIQTCGYEIVINNDGDIFDQDSGKCIIDNNDYDNEYDRDKLLEEYMEKTGVYPGVFYIDQHNNLSLVTTMKIFNVTDLEYDQLIKVFSGAGIGYSDRDRTDEMQNTINMMLDQETITHEYIHELLNEED